MLLHAVDLQKLESLLEQGMLAEVSNGAVDDSITSLLECIVLKSTQDLALKSLALSMKQCSVDDLKSLAFPSATFAHSEADEGFFG